MIWGKHIETYTLHLEPSDPGFELTTSGLLVQRAVRLSHRGGQAFFIHTGKIVMAAEAVVCNCGVARSRGILPWETANESTGEAGMVPASSTVLPGHIGRRWSRRGIHWTRHTHTTHTT